MAPSSLRNFKVIFHFHHPTLRILNLVSLYLLALLLAESYCSQLRFETQIRQFDNNLLTNGRQTLFATLSNKSYVAKHHIATKAPKRVSNQMFCAIAINSEKKGFQYQVVHNLAEADRQNEKNILEDFTEAKLDKQIALDISQVIKTFFEHNFCTVVSKVLLPMVEKENEEVHLIIEKISALNSHIARLIASLAKSPLSKLLQELINSLKWQASKALKDLHALEARLNKGRTVTPSELKYIRTHILLSLVDLFFDESVIRESSSGDIPVANLTTENCLDPTFNEQLRGRQSQLEVSCAFRFLFDSSLQLKKLIAQNFESEENEYYRQSGKNQSKMMSKQRDCDYRNQGSNDVVHSLACHLMADIKNHAACYLSGDHFDYECLKQRIGQFPERYQNKLKQGLTSGDYHALLYALSSLCRGRSAFIAFTLIDIGIYFRKTYPFTKSQQPSKSDANRSSIVLKDTFTTKTAIRHSLGKPYIIESIIAYFLQASEQRLQFIIIPSPN